MVGRSPSIAEHVRVRVLGRIARLRPLVLAPDAAEGAAAASANAASLEERGLPLTHIHFEVERALLRMGVAARADVTTHRGELYPDLFLLPPAPHRRAHHPNPPRHHHHGGGGGEIAGRPGGGCRIIVQALDEGCFVPGTRTPTDYVLAKQVRQGASEPAAASERAWCRA